MKKFISPDEETQEGAVALEGQDTKFAVARRVIQRIRQQLEAVEVLLEAGEGSVDIDDMIRQTDDLLAPALEGRVIEGVFNGEHMTGEDGKQYLVPPNYASKSKLVEGDLLRLTIDSHGRFIFKQRGPIDRQRLIGTLIQDEQTQGWFVVADNQKYRVLPAAISFFKGDANDEVVILIPKGTPSKWAAVENIIKQNGTDAWEV